MVGNNFDRLFHADSNLVNSYRKYCFDICFQFTDKHCFIGVIESDFFFADCDNAEKYKLGRFSTN